MVEADLTSGGADDIGRRILHAIQHPDSLDEARFTDLALRLFERQIAANEFYARYCRAAGVAGVQHWREIPALPTTAFKRAVVACFPVEQAVARFETSGTTDGHPGRHYFRRLDYYDAALVPGFERFVLPKTAGPVRMLMILPPPQEAPHSSLVHMMEQVRKRFGSDGSAWYLAGGALRGEALLRDLEACAQEARPVLVAGTAFGLMHACDAIHEAGMRCALPTGSRLMETGGFKGRSRELERDEFYELLSERFGLQSNDIVNEYGMTELSSQFYDRTAEAGHGTDAKWCPPWARVTVVYPDSQREVGPGERGLIRILDLANVDSVACIQTEDVGERLPDGSFRVLGRVGRAPVRGCSLDAESLRR